MRIVRIERHKPKHDEFARPPIWLIGITDLTTILLAFFILLFATTQQQTRPFTEATESMRARFGDNKENPTESTAEKGVEQSERTWESIEQDPGLDLGYVHSLVKKYIAADPELAHMSIWRNSTSIVFSLPAELGFETGSATLSSYGRRTTVKLAVLLAKLPNNVQVVGHADPMPLRDDTHFNSNWHLSLMRAYAVTQALQDAGYPLKIEAKGRGTTDTDQLPSGMPTHTRHELARRVDIHLSLLKP